MKYFLAKSEPTTYSIDDLERDHKTTWDGVTNPQAVMNIREMRPGDRVFIYHRIRFRYSRRHLRQLAQISILKM